MTDWTVQNITDWLDSLGANADAVATSLAAMSIQWSPNHHHINPIGAAICQRWGSCPSGTTDIAATVDGQTIPLPAPVQSYLTR